MQLEVNQKQNALFETLCYIRMPTQASYIHVHKSSDIADTVCNISLPDRCHASITGTEMSRTS